MDLLRLGQLHNAINLPKEQKLELARKINVTYSIPNVTCRSLQGKSGYNCLHIAAMYLDYDFVHEFTHQGPDLLKQGYKNGKTPLHVVVDAKFNSKNKKIWQIIGKLKECKIVNTLLAVQVSKSNSSNLTCNKGISHLHIACMFNHVQAVNFFLKNGELIHQATNADALWPTYTPLHFAIRYSSVETAEILLTHGADLYAKNAEGSSPLGILISRLINVNDYIYMGERTISVPYEEELKKLETIAKIVIKCKSENGVNVLDETGLTIFHLACSIRHSSIAASYLNDNLNLNMSVKSESKFWPGWTPLHFAACSSSQTVKLLILKGADISMKNTEGETPLDFCLKRYPPRIIHSILSTKDEFQSILLSNSSTKLLDLLLAMDNMKIFNNYLKNLNLSDITVSSTSPLIPGYNLLHLALSMNEKSKSWNDFLTESDTPENLEFLPKVYNCTEDEFFLYSNRIHACLTAGCSVINCDGLTPIHLAFKSQRVNSDTLRDLLNHCEEDMVNFDNLSHLHIACAVGNYTAVQKLLNAGANINATVKKSFQWYKKSEPSSDVKSSELIEVNVNSTPLHVAVTFEHADIVKILLDSGANVYATDYEGFTPLHLSIAQSSNDIARIILSRLQDLIEMVTKESLTHVHVASYAGDANAIRKLVRNGANLNRSIAVAVPNFLSRFAGKTPLQIATQITPGNVAQAIEALIESGADIYANNTMQCLMGETTIDFSQYFIDRLKFNENANESIDSSGLSLLHLACSRLNYEWAKELLNKGADVNARIRSDEDYKGQWKGYTPLHALTYRNNLHADFAFKVKVCALGELLLSRGADVTIDSEDGTVLHMIYNGCVKREKTRKTMQPYVSQEQGIPHAQFGLLIQQAGRSEVYPIPLLRQASARQRHYFLFRQFNLPRNQQLNFDTSLRQFADYTEKVWQDPLASLMLKRIKSFKTNPVSADGFSHFHLFCMADNTEIVEEFLNNAVDVNHLTNPFTSDSTDCSALHFAIKHQAFNVANLLIQRGADVNFENIDGNAPLHVVILQNLIDTQRNFIYSLKKHGANFNAKNLLGETAADLLITKKDLKLEQLKFLLTNGSSISVKKSSSVRGPVALILENALLNERMEILKLFMNTCDMKTVTKNGYSPISDLINIQHNITFYMADDYLHVIPEFMNIDCDVDQPDERGFTALHNAITLANTEAVYALIQVGADLNACNLDSQILLTQDQRQIEEHLAFQVHKMHNLGIYVSDTSESIYRQFRNKGPVEGYIEMDIRPELEKAEGIELGGNLTVRAFLSELRGVVYYSKLSLVQRQTIDEFFKNVVNLLKEFPLLCGLMLVQYKKAVARPKLIESAKQVLLDECEIDLPDLCLECILSCVTNRELKYMIDNAGETENPSKRRKIN